MSLILEALRRADAQRERDPSRGIHAQPVPPGGDEDEAGESFPDPVPPLARRLLPWAAGLVGALAALVGWREIRPPSELTPWAATAASTATAGITAPRPQPQPAQAILPPPPLQFPPAAALHAPAAPPEQRVAPPGPPPVRSALPPGSVAPAPAAAASAGASVAAPPPRMPIPVPPAAPAVQAPGGAPQALGPLPQDAPTLAVTGGVYSADPARRMLIVNGEVVGEGAEPVAGIRVHEIRPGSAVLLFRGQPYAQGF